jgi:exopolysaccharide production protein ExoQ
MQGIESNYNDKYVIKIKYLVFCFWFLWGVKYSFTFFFFQGNPKLGPLINAVISFFFLFSLVIILSSKSYVKKNKILLKPVKLILLLVIWMGLSIIWTEANSTLSVMFNLFLLIIDITVILLFFYIENAKMVGVKSIQGIVFSAGFLSLILFFQGGSTTSGERLGDKLFLHPNVIGEHMAIASICSLYFIFGIGKSNKNIVKVIYGFLGVTILYTLIQTLSKTSILCFCIGILVYIFLGKMGFIKKLLLIMFVGIGVYFSYNFVILYLDNYSSLNGGETLSTLSGRTLIWNTTWRMILDRPMLGYGILSFQDAFPVLFDVPTIQAHNEILNTWFLYGVIGLLLVIGIYFSYTITMFKGRKNLNGEMTLGIALLLMSLVRGMTEAKVIGLVYPLPLIIVMVIWVVNKNQQQNKPRIKLRVEGKYL